MAGFFTGKREMELWVGEEKIPCDSISVFNDPACATCRRGSHEIRFRPQGADQSRSLYASLEDVRHFTKPEPLYTSDDYPATPCLPLVVEVRNAALEPFCICPGHHAPPRPGSRRSLYSHMG